MCDTTGCQEKPAIGFEVETGRRSWLWWLCFELLDHGSVGSRPTSSWGASAVPPSLKLSVQMSVHIRCRMASPPCTLTLLECSKTHATATTRTT
jgi:hypothetical protein